MQRRRQQPFHRRCGSAICSDGVRRAACATPEGHGFRILAPLWGPNPKDPSTEDLLGHPQVDRNLWGFRNRLRMLHHDACSRCEFGVWAGDPTLSYFSEQLGDSSPLIISNRILRKTQAPQTAPPNQAPPRHRLIGRHEGTDQAPQKHRYKSYERMIN